MADLNRWSVTYTKHVKQKRKVFQDGFLELHASSNKLLLYDDCEKLLECKILKKDETVSCGETLNFNAFLVDVNGAEGFHEPSLGRGDRSGVDKYKSHKLNLSPSQKIIRDFKKREILKYEAIQQSKSPETVKSSVTEWEALYTTQITQKAKKYRDGFVQLSVRGSLGRQAVLLDESRNNLSTRFLKKDEKIEPGGTITFDGYLVEVGECRPNDNNSGENNSKATKENGIVHGHKNYACRNNTLLKVPDSIKTEYQAPNGSEETKTEPNTAEWQVLYTTQLTQKSKKYHDGFLQFAICGSRGRQAVLLDATKTILHSRLLRKEEVIRTGLSMKFDAYLIDIGELEGNHATESTALKNSCNVEKTEKIPRQQNSFALKSNTLKGQSLAYACLKKDAEPNFRSSKVDSKESTGRVPMKKPLRDASQILSFLQKPRTEKSTASCNTESKMTPTEGPLVSNVSDLAFSEDYQPLNLMSSALPNRSAKNVDTTELTRRIEPVVPWDNHTRPFEAMPTSSNCTSSQLMVDAHNGKPNQKLFSEMEANTAGNTSTMPSAVEEKNPAEGISSAEEMDEYPSFDLGL